MKKIYFYLIGSIGLGACSNQQTPTPSKLAQDIQTIPAQTVLSLRAQSDLNPPKDAQSIVKLATFIADDNLYDTQGNKVIIPRGALIVGLYANDGVNCSVEWKAVYANQKELEAAHGTLTLNQVTSKSNCQPEKGIKRGERVTISFTQNLDNYGNYPLTNP